LLPTQPRIADADLRTREYAPVSVEVDERNTEIGEPPDGFESDEAFGAEDDEA
jgi:hypothetical protein